VAGSEEVLDKLRNAAQTAKPAAKKGSAKPAPAPEQEPAPAPEEPEEDEEELSLDDL
jgi:ribosomal protein L12E/L44/L45/RPP1/RPP2